MDQLLAMGFPEETAKAALEAHGNDLARSLDALLSSEPASTQSSSPEVSGPQESALGFTYEVFGTTPQHLPGAGVKYKILSLRAGLVDADRVQAVSYRTIDLNSYYATCSSRF